MKTHPPKQDCVTDREIYITTNGVHLDIVLPVENVEPEFLSRLEILPGTKYVSFGWGDKEFYINTPQWKDLTLKTAFKALFLKSKNRFQEVENLGYRFFSHSGFAKILLVEVRENLIFRMWNYFLYILFL
jgi:hypothetical protein